jgi:Dolichyl-phosphate-mannose-protein mannosyltransferase
MGAGDYVVGLLGFAAMLLACGGAAWVVVARRLRGLPLAERATAFGILATLAVAGVHLVPGALGVLGEPAVLVASGLVLGATWWLVRPVAAPRPGYPEPIAPDGRASMVVAGVGVAAVVVYLLALVLSVARQPTTQADMMAFHLPGVAQWIRTGSVWGIHQWTPDWGFGYYPGNGDLLLLSAVLPWRSDFAARLVDAPYFALLGLAVYTLARELRAPAAPSALFGVALLAVPAVSVIGAQGLPDTPMLATFAVGCAFLLRHARTGARADLVLGGIGLGLAFGTKWYGVTAVTAVLAVWVVAAIVRRRGRRALASFGVLVGLVLATGGFWLLRNLVAVGNPVFPFRVAPVGVTIFDAPPDPLRARAGHPLARYLFDGHALDRYLLPDFGRFVSLAAVVLLVGLVVGGVAAALRRPSWPVLALAAAAVLILVLYVLTPFSGQGEGDQPTFAWVNVRYGLPALVPAAALAAWASARLGRAGLALELAALAGIADGIRLGLHVPARWIVAAVVVVAAVAGLAYLSRRRPPRAATAAGAGAAVLLAAGLAGYALERRFLRHRYEKLDPVLEAIRLGAPSGHRIGLAGDVTGADFVPILPAFGPRFDNAVGYAGAVTRGMLRRAPNGAAFAHSLRRGRYDLLLVSRAPTRPDRPVPEEAWAVRDGYAPALRSARFTLYRRLG